MPATERLLRPSPVPASDHITLRQLADELGVEDVERLRPLVEHKYLKLLKVEEFLQDCIVARPYPDGMKWLKNLMAPILLCPVITLDYVRMLLGVSWDELRSICIHYRIIIHCDPVFQELMTISEFYRLFRKLNYISTRPRFDRQMMLQMFQSQLPNSKNFVKKPFKYNEMLEEEIRRVRDMPEPDRTFRAMSLWEAFRDAKFLKTCLERLERYKLTEVDRIRLHNLDKEQVERRTRIEQLMEKMMRRCVGNANSYLTDEPTDASL